MYVDVSGEECELALKAEICRDVLGPLFNERAQRDTSTQASLGLGVRGCDFEPVLNSCLAGAVFNRFDSIYRSHLIIEWITRKSVACLEDRAPWIDAVPRTVE